MNRLGSRDRAGIDALVERTLAHARVAREPSAADKERVLTALRDYLDDPTGALQDDSALQDDVGLHEGDVLSGVREIVQGAVRPAVSPLARWARPWSALPASVQKLVWVSAVTGGLGFWVGSQPEPAGNPSNGNAPTGDAAKAVASDVGPSPTRTSEATSEPSIMPIAPIAPVRSLPSEAPLASLERAAATAAAPVKAAPPAIAARPAVAPLPEPRRSLAPLSPPVERPAPATAPPARLPEAAVPPAPVFTPAVPPAPAALPPAALPPPFGSDAPSDPPPSPPAGDPRFLEAVRLVQRAQRAVESGAASTALSLLDELDARFPAALLNEERLATRVLALCAGGAVARAKRVAAELGARNSSSIYAARIAQSCAGSAASSPAAPPAPRR